MKVLILGFEGGLGQAFMQVYKSENPIGLDRNEIDIADRPAILQKIAELRPELVINCAGYTAVDKAETDRETADSINGLAPGYIAAACQQIGATLVHFGTGMVFDGINKNGYDENAETKPVNAYGESKLLGELEVQKNTDKYYLVRSAWLFGKTKSGKKSFIEIMLEKANNKEAIKAVSDEFGTPTYDWDLAQATRALVEEHKPYGIYHLFNEGVASRYDWAKEIFRIKDITVDLSEVSAADFSPRPAKRPQYEVLINRKFIKLRPWQEALRDFLNS